MKLFVFGLGYAASFIVRDQLARGARVVGTVRTIAKAELLTAKSLSVRVFSPDQRDGGITDEIAGSEALLVSIPPDGASDPVLAVYAETIAKAPNLRWIGYLSTIGVYGDHRGGWVDETTPVAPTSERSRRRAAAEQAWLDFGARHQVPVHVFRLAGIYGPGRNQLVQLAQGKARRIVKRDQVFNRIHVEDIARVIDASLARPDAGAIYNVTDDEPSPPQDVVAYAAQLCGRPAPPEIPFEIAEFTPMGRSFYSENKRARNSRLHRDLGVTLAFPNYREGLRALGLAGEGS